MADVPQTIITDLERLATAADRIAAALEAIALHLAPVIVNRMEPVTDGQLRIGEYVVDRTSSDPTDSGTITAIDEKLGKLMLRWDNGVDSDWWPIADFVRKVR